MALIGDHLRRMRERAGLSQGALGARIGLEQSYVSRMERGERGIDSAYLERWAEACGFHIEIVGPEHDDVVQAAKELDVADIPLARMLLKLLPRLDPADRRTLQLLVDGWYQSSGAPADPADSQASTQGPLAATGRRA